MAFDTTLAGRIRDALAHEGETVLRESHVRAFDITGKPMRNWVAVEPEGVEDDDQLKDWLERAIKFVKTLPRQ